MGTTIKAILRAPGTKRKQRENNHANSCPLKEQQPRSLYRYFVQLATHFESPHFGEPRFYKWVPRQEVQK